MTNQSFTGGKDFPVKITRMKNGAQFTIRDIFVIMDLNQLQELRNYLDMEFVPPYIGLGDTLKCLRVYQEGDGTTWVRVYHTEERSGRISCLSDDETGRLYEWLNSWLDKP